MGNEKIAWILSAAITCLGVALALLLLQEDGPLPTEDFLAAAAVGGSPGIFVMALVGIWTMAKR